MKKVKKLKELPSSCDSLTPHLQPLSYFLPTRWRKPSLTLTPSKPLIAAEINTTPTNNNIAFHPIFLSKY